MKEKFLMFRNRLTKVYRHLSRQAGRYAVTCYRIYDHDLPEFPFCIELYEKKIYVAEYLRRHGMNTEEHLEWLSNCVNMISKVLSIPPAHIFLKTRKKITRRRDQYKSQLSTLQPAAGSDPQLPLNPNEFIVNEGGLKFIVNLTDYLDTGLFLDHRVTRQMIREQSSGKKVLNLFAYTCSFSVYAADGGAREVQSLDLSKTYLDWGRRNFELNSFIDPGRYCFIQTDILQWLQEIPADYFDLIILDPPTFSNSQRMKDILDIQRDHAGLINKCLYGLRPGGRIYFSTNYLKFELGIGKINTRQVKDITKSTIPFDFEGKLVRKCLLIEK